MAAGTIDLGARIEDFDERRSVGMNEARRMMRGRRGDGASLEVVRRYANPKRGCRPLGKAGPLLVLPAVRVGGELRTMPEWVRAFCRARAVLLSRPEAPAARPARGREAAARRAEEALDRAGVGRKK